MYNTLHSCLKTSAAKANERVKVKGNIRDKDE